jgi:peptidoglycan hydrolase CwlO-like protein
MNTVYMHIITFLVVIQAGQLAVNLSSGPDTVARLGVATGISLALCLLISATVMYAVEEARDEKIKELEKEKAAIQAQLDSLRANLRNGK